jgi:peptide/nickel transport system substrate-binding protein
MSNDRPLFDVGKGVTRRQVVRGAATAGFLVGTGGLLAACDSGDETTKNETAGPPQRGGALRVGMPGGGSAESLNPGHGALNGPNIARCYALYDPLIRVMSDNSLKPGLAESWEPNDTYDLWTLKLRPDVKWSDGSPFTADDVVYSLRFLAAPEYGASVNLTKIRLNDLKKVDPLTVQVPLKKPNLGFPAYLIGPDTCIVKEGTKTFDRPVGTGPFRFKSFSPGQQSVFTRNPDYWDNGKPYVDEVVITAINDETARLNALLSGNINVLGRLPYVQGKAQRDSNRVKLLDTPSNMPYLFYMRVDVAPFDDVRVRQAMKYIADRPALVAGALDGFGEVANDLVGKGLQFYDSSIPQREQDIEKAKSLLSAAGHSNLEVTLNMSNVQAGLTQAATLFADQAKEAGVTVRLKTVQADAWFNPSLQYLKMPFASSFWQVADLPSFYTSAFGPDAPYNETHWLDPAFDKLMAEATSATSEEQATELWSQLQKQQFDEGGYLVWANANNLDACGREVNGIVPSRSYALGAPMGFIDAWIAS